MTQKEQNKKLGDTLWDIANDLRGAMNADDFRDYMLRFCSFGICLLTTKKLQREN
jgi:type I restriction-modification system DNA methylase subunit